MANSTYGHKKVNLGRLALEIDRDPLSMLFDTGDVTRLTDEAVTKIGDGLPLLRATSLMAWPFLRSDEMDGGMDNCSVRWAKVLQ